MLEGVLKAKGSDTTIAFTTSFNPWYVGGGVKSIQLTVQGLREGSFNPWYVGGGVKSHHFANRALAVLGFNPWYVGGGVKSADRCTTAYLP